jgi:RNA polymerase sigma-70 factor (ECF subfamily)
LEEEANSKERLKGADEKQQSAETSRHASLLNREPPCRFARQREAEYTRVSGDGQSQRRSSCSLTGYAGCIRQTDAKDLGALFTLTRASGQLQKNCERFTGNTSAHSFRPLDGGQVRTTGKALNMQWRRAPREADDLGCALPAESQHAHTLTDTDVAMFNALIAQHAERMIRVAAAIVGTMDAEDAAQEAIVRAWRAWPTLRDRGAFSAWLLRITVNVGRDWLRGRFGAHRRLNESLDDAETEADFPATLFGDDPGASDHAAALDLRHAISQLDTELRTVVALRYFAGLDATEIGAALAIPPTTVRTRLRRALRRLRDRLDDSSEHPAARSREENRHA